MVDFERLLKNQKLKNENKENKEVKNMTSETIEKKESEKIMNFKIPVTEAKKFEIPIIEDGEYNGTLESMELKVNVPDGHGGVFDMLQWNFDVDGIKLSGKSSTIISNLSKANDWIEAMTGKKLPSGTEFSPELITGKKCRVIVKHQKRIKTFNGEQETINQPYIDDVLLLKKGK